MTSQHAAETITIDIPTGDDWDAIFSIVTGAFHQSPNEAESATERTMFEPSRSLIARRGADIVGSAGIFTRQLSAPGAVIPAAHVTLVAVAPTARRQRVMTRFMHRQLSDIRTSGEPVAILWASEGKLYQRFGYGLATRRLTLTIDTREVRVTTNVEGVSRLRDGTPADLRDSMAKIYDEAYTHHPGWSERTPRHWDVRVFDHESNRQGATALRAVIHEGPHGPDGYALWRAAGTWNESGPAGEVRVLEQVSTTSEAYAAIWDYLLTIDLTRTTKAWGCSVDEPLALLVNEPRRLGAHLADALWLRITDLPAALSARRYATHIDTVLDVTDDLISENTGRWRLTAGPDAASCVATHDTPDLVCDIRALGAAYLGGTSLTDLAAAGQVHERRPGTLAQAATAFGWHQTASSFEVF